jgi:Arc/MetJ family transcription regulator
MRTNIEIDSELMAQVMRLTGARTKREAVDRALRETLRLRQQETLLQLWGRGWDGDLSAMRTDTLLPAE